MQYRQSARKNSTFRGERHKPPCGDMHIINGPISREIAVNSGVGCLGPGNIANATIGRAIRLCMMNIAGAVRALVIMHSGITG